MSNSKNHFNQGFSGNSGFGNDRDDAVDSNDISKLATNVFSDGANAMSNAKIGETRNFLGFEVDAGLAAWFTTSYNILSKFAKDILQPRAYNTAKSLGRQMGLEGNALNKTAAGAAIITTVGLKAGAYIEPIFKSLKEQRDQKTKMAHDLAPILDDMKGRHTVGALYNVKQSENEVIFVQRKRLGKIAHQQNFAGVVNLAGNLIPGLLFDVKTFGTMLRTTEDLTAAQIRESVLAKKATPKDGEHTVGDQLKDLGENFMGFSSSQVTDRIIKTNEYSLVKSLQPYTAYEMIQELEKQVSSNPKARSFSLPKAFGNDSQGKSVPLEEYIMMIFVQHQKDMADVSPDHTELREALHEDLAAVTGPIADAIRAGDMSALSLIRLVGEGHIIKNNGRAIAAAEDVEELIVRDAPKEVAYVHSDPKEYYQAASFTREDLKSALKILDTEEKYHLASMIPDSVLEEAGMSVHDVKEMRAAVMKDYEQMLAEGIVGLHGKSDEELKQSGLAQREITFLHKAFEHLGTDGLKAVRELRSGPTNSHGIERVLTNLAVGQILGGDTTYLGTLRTEGREKFDEVVSERTSDKGRAARGTHQDRLRGSIPPEEERQMKAERHGDRGFAGRVKDGAAQKQESFAPGK